MSFLKNLLALLVLSFILISCASKKPAIEVLTETEAFYLNPPNVSFPCVIVEGGEVLSCVRGEVSYNVSASYLIRLEEQANACVLGTP